MATEIADAYIALYTKMPGVKGDIERSLGKADAKGAGAKLGDELGGGISTKTAALAGAVGGVVATIAQQGIAAISDLVGEAVIASDATDKFKQTLGFAGIDTSTIDKVTKQTRKYADDTVFDLATIQNTTAQLAANSVPDYEKLTEAAGNLNAVAGGNNDTFRSVAMVLTQTAGAGKLTTENWNQLANAIPGASGVLIDSLKKAGAFTGNFRDAMAKGEITSEEFNTALMKVGSQPIAVAAAKSTSTMEGAVGNLAASITGKLSDAFTAIKPALTGFTSLLAGFISN
ncbi:MAG TPA: tape measure protein, partial [Vicinamibacterales bacterium]